MRTPVLVAAVLALLVVGYVVARLSQRALDPRYQSFAATPTLAEARDAGTLLAEYRAEPLAPDAPGTDAVYADRPTRLTLGPVLQPQPVTAEAVRVVARLDENAARRGLRLAFDDGAGVRLNADGTADAGPFDDETTGASDRVQCCFAFRSEAPARFWLERDGERVVAFTRLP